ncbi:MAG: polyprenyl synthetase family protein [Desulfoprunum sp.]|nr:polyprenyl synthetase family protein [Desulfoprunum sp.]
MTDTKILLAAIHKDALRIDMAMRDDLAGLTPKVDGLLAEVLEYSLFNGGKRIRPLLVVIAARLCGREDAEIYQLARAFEYLHAATLLHDDVIDNADTRRGKPSVYRQYGLVSAILTGDFLHAKSMAIVGQIGGKEALALFSEAAAGMVDGEFMQLRNAGRYSLSEDDYIGAIMGKTALLIAAACEIGVLYAQGHERKRKALRAYGVQLGCAFQMIDDLLDYQGETAKTGKPVGNDLVEGKMTLPLILALHRADAQDRGRLLAILGSEAARRQAFSEVYHLIDKYNGFSATREKAEESVSIAVQQLEIFTDESAASDVTVLQGLTQYVLKREK